MKCLLAGKVKLRSPVYAMSSLNQIKYSLLYNVLSALAFHEKRRNSRNLLFLRSNGKISLPGVKTHLRVDKLDVRRIGKAKRYKAEKQ